jgi:acyl-CoA reductase-like NAD-dependent aldehyde dehydrogenase
MSQYQFNKIRARAGADDVSAQHIRNTTARQQGAVCLASSRIYVQNLIQFGNPS